MMLLRFRPLVVVCRRERRRWGARRGDRRADHRVARDRDGGVRDRGAARPGGRQPAAKRVAGDAERGVSHGPAGQAAVAGQDPAAARGVALPERDDRRPRRHVRRGLPGGRPERGPEAARGDPRRRLREGDGCRTGGPPVRGRPRRADRRTAAAGAVPCGQRLPLRQRDDEAFATAVHLLVDLDEGATRSPAPATRRRCAGTCRRASGSSTTRAAPPSACCRAPSCTSARAGCSRARRSCSTPTASWRRAAADIDAGIAWLQRAARDAIGHGFEGAARRIIGQVESGDDDRAVLILSRTAAPGI